VFSCRTMYYIWGKVSLVQQKSRVRLNWPKMFLLLFVVFVALYVGLSAFHVNIRAFRFTKCINCSWRNWAFGLTI
jgi:hypothetical protein